MTAGDHGYAAKPRMNWRDARHSAFLVPLIACALVLAIKIALIGRINVNWDEFYFLAHVHSLVRGELDRVFQLSYTFIFAWLPWVGADEMAQILAGRAVMLVLLIGTVVLVAALASRWSSPGSSMVAALSFIAALPVLKHGGSFRADSLLAPLSVGVLLLLTTGPPNRRATAAAGICFGLALVATAKAILLLPVVGLLVIAAGRWHGESHEGRLADSMRRLVIFAVIAVGTSALILSLHRLAMPIAPTHGAGTMAGGAARKVLLDVPLFPQWDYLLASLRTDRATWILMGTGLVVAIAKRHMAVAACALSLLPIVFYRNSFPYFYVFMLAPACALVAIAVDAARSWVVHNTQRRAEWIPVALCVPLVLQAGVNLYELRHDNQAPQRDVLAVVHQIFPEPVAYIDHSGMVASFRKANFFMSSWGIETYQAAGKSFMREAIARHRPPLLLINSPVLNPESALFDRLLPEDKRLIVRYYLPYWGPVRVAGAQVELQPLSVAELSVPFPGLYRLELDGPIKVNGIVRTSGDVLNLPDGRCTVVSESDSGKVVTVRLIWAAAQPAPFDPGVFPALYRPL